MVKSYNKCTIDNKNKDNIINLNPSNIQLNYIGSPYDTDNNRTIPLIKLDNIRTTLDDTTDQYELNELDDPYYNKRQRNITSKGDDLDIDIQLFANDVNLLDGKLEGGNNIDTKYGLFAINIDIPEENIPIDENTNEPIKIWIAPWMYDKYPDTRPEQGYITTAGDEDNNITSPSSLTWLEFNRGFSNNINWDDIAPNNETIVDEMFSEIPNEEKKYYGIINEINESDELHTLWFKRNSVVNPLYANETQWQGYINPLVIFLTYGRDIDEANRNYLYGCSNIIKIQLRTERCLEGWSGFPNCDTQCCRSETFPQCKIDNEIINIRDYQLREYESQEDVPILGEGVIPKCRIKIGEEKGTEGIIDITKFDRNKCAEALCDEKGGEYIPEKISYTCFDDLSENNRFSEIPDAESYCNLEVTAGIDLSLSDAALMQSGAANLIQSYNNCNYDKKIKTGIDTDGGECIERRCPKGKFGKNCDNNCCAGVCVWPEKYNNPLLGEYQTYKEWCSDKRIDPIIPPQRCGCSFDPNELTLRGSPPPDYKIEGNEYEICTNSSQCNTLKDQEKAWTDIAVNINNRNWADSSDAKDTVEKWGRMQSIDAIGNNIESGDWGCGKAQRYDDNDGYGDPPLNPEKVYLGCEPVWAADSDKCQYYPNAENNGNGGLSEGINETGDIIKNEVCSQCLEGWYGPECNMKCCGGLCGKTLDEKSCAQQSSESNELCDFYPSINMCLSSCQGETREECVSSRGCRWGTDEEEGLKTSPTGNPLDGNIGPYCLNNECSCMNGTAAKGLQCPMHDSEACTSCDRGYEKSWGRGIMSDYYVCKPATGITNLLEWYLNLIRWDEIYEDFLSSGKVGPVRIVVFLGVIISSICSLIVFIVLMSIATAGVKALMMAATGSITISILLIVSFTFYYVPLLFNNYIWSIIPNISIPFTPYSIGGGTKISTAFLLFRAPYLLFLPILCGIVLIVIIFTLLSSSIKIITKQ